MEKELREQLEKLSKEELIEHFIKLTASKIEVQKDLTHLGKMLVQVVKTLGVVDDELNIIGDKSTIIKKVASLASMSMIKPNHLEKQFSFIGDSMPLLEKYKHLLK